MEERIRELLLKHNIPIAEIKRKLGDKVYSKVWNYLSGNQKTLTSDILIVLADFFGVSVDYILGRSDYIEPNYEMKVEELYRKSYEKYVVSGNGHGLNGYDRVNKQAEASVIAPWPYNFIEMAKLPFETPIPDQILDNLEKVIDETLTKREAVCVRLYFKECMTLDEIGKEFNVTRERIRQIIAKACRKTRHPSRIFKIKNGLDYQKKVNEEYERKLKERIDSAAEKRLELEEIAEEHQEQKRKIFPIEDLNLSVRSYNCLRRANIFTVDQLIYVINNDPDKFVNIRNLGSKSIEEILNKLGEVVV